MKISDIAVSAAVYIIATWFLIMTLALPPDAQTYPLILITALYVTNTMFIGKRFYVYFEDKLHVENDLPKLFEGFLAKQFFTVFIGCIAYLAVLNFLGYYLSSVLYLLAMQFLLKVRPIPAVISCVCMMVVTYLVFSMFLKVPLPVGSLFGI